MANDLSTVVWKLDTAGGGVLRTHQIKIKYVVWVNAAAVNDTFTLLDMNGKEILSGVANAANQMQAYDLENWYQGINLSQLSSGRIEVHIR